MEAVVRFLLQHPIAAMRIRRGLEEPVSPLSNDEMIDSMQREKTLTNERCIEAFRSVDRKPFAPESEKTASYAPMPLREGVIHLSAPPIYAEAIECLMPIEPGMSFLNIGSGTGYFNSVVAHLLHSEPYISTNHGIEVWPQAINYCKEKLEEVGLKVIQRSQFFQGNIYELDVKNSMTYDRIYIGACASSKSKYLYELLEVGGVLVGPFQTSTGAQQLRRVTRLSGHEFRTEILKSVAFASLVEPAPFSDKLCSFFVPEEPWNIERHPAYPRSFRSMVPTLLHIAYHQGLPEVWIDHILPFCRRHWFDTHDEERESKRTSCSSRNSPVEKKLKRNPTESTLDASPTSSCSLYDNETYDTFFPRRDYSPRSTASFSRDTRTRCGRCSEGDCFHAHAEGVAPDEASDSSSEGIVEIFEDGTRHRVGEAGTDPDELGTPNNVPFEIRGFLALAYEMEQLRQQNRPVGALGILEMDIEIPSETERETEFSEAGDTEIPAPASASDAESDEPFLLGPPVTELEPSEYIAETDLVVEEIW